MGFGEFLKKQLIPGYQEYTLINDIIEHGVVDGFKENIRRERQEDNPFTSHLYQEGKSDGKKEGYVKASKEYEAKLLSQADEFLKQKTIYEKQRDEYDKLLKEYEAEIERLSQKQAKTEEENKYLQELLLRERGLRKLFDCR